MASEFVVEKNGRKYLYRSVSFWDKDKKAPRSHMEYVGRVMDDGTVVKKKEKQAAAPGSSAEYELANARLKKEIGRLEKENDLLRERVKSLSNIARKNLSQAMSALDKLEDL